MKIPAQRDYFPGHLRTLAALLVVMGAGYFLMSDLMCGTLFEHHYWDSYTLQTWNWFQGRTWIAEPEKYEYLELAIYNGKYYLSFPPLPSVVLIPFVAAFGMDTPSNLLVALYGLFSAALAYFIMLRRGRTPNAAAFWALVLVWGSNIMFMTTIGGVWFMAQTLNMVMCLAAVLCALDGRKALSTTFLALAVGCRPLSGLFLPIFAFLFAWNEREIHGGFWKSCLAQWRCLIGPILIGACYMVYNYVRFDDPLEFGHNYLPEFMRAEHGQFHISYLWPNIKQMFFTPVQFTDGRLSFPLFQGFMFFVANPMFVVWFVRCGGNAAKKRVSAEGISIAAGVAAMLLLTCMHRTLGAWQFGSRYSCDALPFVYMTLADRAPKRVTNWELAIGGLAVAFNLYGAMYLYMYG